ncbi:MAG: hypothetical protein IJ578_06325 [Bacteroidales bacterium]|nr:hypothetical protein [Bacteroidales bacterium]
MKKYSYIVLAVLILACASCRERVTGGRPVIPYVAGLLSDTTSYDYGILSMFNPANKAGSIAVIGEPEDALFLTEQLLTSDRYDNIDGALRPDGLPDFAGEIFAPVLDVANAPYGGYFTHGNEDYLSEITVRNFLAVLDTACFLSSYDTDRLVHKAPAKMVVLASSYSTAYGYFNIDTLCHVAGRDVPVIPLTRAMLDAAWNRYGNGINVGIWTTGDVLGAGIWSAAFPYAARRHGDAKATYSVFCPDSSATVLDRFMNYMQMYAAAGNTAKISALVLDDPAVPLDSLRAAVSSVMKVDRDSYITWRNLLADDFEIIDAGSAVASACYAYLRENNRFTHKVAYPDVKVYATAPVNGLPETAYGPDGWLTEEFRYNRASNVGDPTYSLVELKDKYLTEELRDRMIVRTPKLFSLYVQ